MDLIHRRTTSLLAVFLLGLVSIIAAITVASPASAATDPSVWVGSPYAGTWCKTYDTCPKGHHIAYGGDWSADIGQGIATGTAIHLYAAPGDGRTDIRAKVETVGPACADRNLSHGGYRVTVGFYKAGTTNRIGWVTYAHLQPSVKQGTWINRWGTKVGTVGHYTSNSCWTGNHTHVEMYSTHNYACYNGSWNYGQAMKPSNFIGYTGGSKAHSQRAACP